MHHLLPPDTKVRRTSAGLTLLEMCLALAIGLTLAALAIPTANGWIEERAFRSETDALADTVMRAKIEAETTGESRLLRFAEKKTSRLSKLSPEEEKAAVYQVKGGFELERMGRRGQWEDAGGSVLRIQAGGVVSPVLFRLKRNNGYIVFRFDPLTGHMEEKEFQF